MILIIPDIHGRNFWKKAVEENKDKVDKIILLGDYLDPYPWEGITRKEAISNFQEIIDFKSENRDKVVLFVGNHDLAYIDKKNYIQPFTAFGFWIYPLVCNYIFILCDLFRV